MHAEHGMDSLQRPGGREITATYSANQYGMSYMTSTTCERERETLPIEVRKPDSPVCG